MCGAVHRPKFFGIRLLRATAAYPRPQRDVQHRHASGGVTAHHALGGILIGVDAKSLLRRNRQEPQHVATGQRCDEGFLRIHAGRIRERQRHDVRRRRCFDDGTTIELPAMRARVAVVREARVAALPADHGGV
jgi:hypothetical protein